LVAATPNQPGFRVLHNSPAGRTLIEAAQKENIKLSGARDALASLAQCSEFFQGMCGRESVKYFMEHGKDAEAAEGDAASDHQFLPVFDKYTSTVKQLMHLCTLAFYRLVASRGTVSSHLSPFYPLSLGMPTFTQT